MRINKGLLAIAILVVAPQLNCLLAQTNHLEKRISIDLEEVRLKNALPKIGESGGFQFSYNSEIIPGDSLVSVHAVDKRVYNILSDLNGPGIRYKVLGNHVIMLSDMPNKRPSREIRNLEYTITGYIYDAQTGEIISSASIYEVEGMFVSATDSRGFYSLTVPGERDKQVLSYSKQGYLDTLIVVQPKEQATVNIYLKPKAREYADDALSALPPAGLNDRKLVAALVPAKARTTADNIGIIEKQWAQISLFPFIGSNRFVSGLITNRLSLNVFAGYSGAIRGVELGSFLNVVRKEMYGVQLSGFGNIVGQKSKGIQLSGFFNVDAGSFSGLQATGFSNVVTDTIRGIQLAGFSNVLRGPMYGTQVCGFSNFTSQNVDGIQAAGFLNIAGKDVKIAQLSGFANYSRSVSGLQAAGFMNIASGTSKGIQVAGFMNYATELRGLQVSLFNIADTVSAGVPIGLFSFVVKGYHTIEVSANEFFPVNVSLKTGVRRFYNIFTAGLQKDWLSVGYGVGTQLRLARRLTFSLDLTSSYVSDNRNILGYKGALLRFTPTFDIEVAKHFKLILGPTINGFAALNSTDPGTASLPLYFSLPMSNRTIAGNPATIWMGATAGFRF